MILRKLLRNRGVGVNLLAGFCFILLMVFVWGLPLSELARYFFIFLLIIAIVIGFAALFGWLLHKILNRRD